MILRKPVSVRTTKRAFSFESAIRGPTLLCSRWREGDRMYFRPFMQPFAESFWRARSCRESATKANATRQPQEAPDAASYPRAVPLIEDRLMSAKEVREPHDGLRMAARRSVFHQEGPVQPTCPAPGGPSGGQDAPRGLFMHPRMQTSVNAPTPIESRYAFRAHSEEVCLRRSQL